jgi:hypothetical protein
LDGNVVYAGGIGPFGFKPEELNAAIEEYLVGMAERAPQRDRGS